MLKVLLITLILSATSADGAEDASAVISEGRRDANGILVHDLTCPFQAGVTRIRVLAPDHLDAKKQYPVVYVLPVEPRDESRYGDGLLEVTKGGLNNECQAIFVSPTFSQMPWYADHPTNPEIRQETYFLKVVIPFVESHYPARTDADGRLLLGFSKSGWGAYSLLLRHPDLFGKAVAWDAPLMLDKPGQYGSGPIFGTQENFERYQITRLLDAHPQSGNRLILLGYGNFRQHDQRLHDLMERLKIDHIYRDGPERKHIWGSGWLPEAVKLLLDGAK